jgi:hypothetical protein
MRLWWQLCICSAVCAVGCAHSDGAAKQTGPAVVTAPAQPLPQVADKPPALPKINGVEPTVPEWTGTPTVIELIDAGSEPRRPMTYAVEPRSRQTIETIDDSPLYGPRIVYTVSLEVVWVKDGWVTLNSTITTAHAEARSTDKESSEELTKSVSPIVSSSDIRTTSIYGEAGQRVLFGPDYVKSMIESRGLELVRTVPFPRAAIGVGATWKVSDVGDTVKAVESVTLTSIENDTLKLSSTFAYTYVAGNKPAPVHGTAEWTVHLDKMASSGTTHLWVDGQPELDTRIEVRVDD